MPKFELAISAAGNVAKRSVEADDTSEAVAHTYVALTTFMATNPLRTQIIAVTISDAVGAQLAQLTLDMKIFDTRTA